MNLRYRFPTRYGTPDSLHHFRRVIGPTTHLTTLTDPVPHTTEESA